MPDAVGNGASIVVDGNRWVSVGMGGAYGGTFELDPSKKPKAFDLVITEGHAAGTRNLGIYELAGDRWTFCLAMRGDARPRKFATKPESGLALETLERGEAAKAKSKAKSKRSAPGIGMSESKAPSLDVGSGPATELEGEWAMVAGVFNGTAMAESMVAWCKRITRGDVTMVVAGPKVMLKARFTVDDTTRPHAVDYVNLEGSHARKSQAGIVERQGDELRVCMSAPGKPRPTEFSSRPGDGRSYTIWRLVKT